MKIAEEETSAALNHAEKQIWTWSIILSFIFVFGWPLLALPAGVFSKASHTTIVVKLKPIATVIVTKLLEYHTYNDFQKLFKFGIA